MSVSTVVTENGLQCQLNKTFISGLHILFINTNQTTPFKSSSEHLIQFFTNHLCERPVTARDNFTHKQISFIQGLINKFIELIGTGVCSKSTLRYIVYIINMHISRGIRTSIAQRNPSESLAKLLSETILIIHIAVRRKFGYFRIIKCTFINRQKM